MRTTLDTLCAGERATVIEVNGAPETVERLMELGVVAGTPVELCKFAPLGDPVEIQVRGYHLSIRRAEASGIAVEK
jgi:Fe2+ transport system protein FeoA